MNVAVIGIGRIGLPLSETTLARAQITGQTVGMLAVAMHEGRQELMPTRPVELLWCGERCCIRLGR